MESNNFHVYQAEQRSVSETDQIHVLPQRVERLEQQLQRMQQQLQQRSQVEALSPRLHIAALIAAGWAANPDIDQNSGFEAALAIADKLIKAAETSQP
ncbi:MAG: hypothetical protein ACO3YZ_03510 [Candidatus Nanopelagicaceae bacterium]